MPDNLTALLPQTLNWDSSFDNTLYGNGRILIRIHALIMPISQAGFASHLVLFCLLSFTGLIGIYRFFEKVIQIPEKWLFGIIFLLPSVLFWSSAMTKEALVFFFTGLFFFFLEKVSQNGHKLVFYPLILLIVFLLMQTRLALMLLLLPALFAWLLKQRLPGLKAIWVYLLTYFLFAVAIVLVNGIQHADIPGIIAFKQKGFVLVAVQNQVQYYTAAPMLTGSWLSLLVSLPVGFLQALIHPHLVEGGHLFMKFSALENVVVLCLGALALLHFRKEARNENLTWFLLMLIVTGFSFNGLICPVTGALVRYKSMFLLFLVLFFVHVFDVEKFKLRFGLKK